MPYMGEKSKRIKLTWTYIRLYNSKNDLYGKKTRR